MSSGIATLVIYAYASFASSWGPGPELVKIFEKQCHCLVQIVSQGDGAGVLNRLKLEGEKTHADIVIGLDDSLKGRALEEQQWLGELRAFDHGPYAFVYNDKVVTNPPHSLDDLLDPQWKGQIAIEDPRLSTPGLGFLLWIIKEKGDGAWDYLKKLKNQIKVVSPSWDLAYGLFKKDQVKLVLSYWTSPAYHIQEENNNHIKASAFTNGNYSQTEYVGALANKRNDKLKTDFLDFLLSAPAQEILARKNFMYPVNPKANLPPAFKQIGNTKELSPLSTEELKKVPDWLSKWREIFS